MSRRKGPSLDREQVVQATMDLVNREGPDACGVNRVARALGIKPPSLYNHVAGNDDLRKAVVLEGSRDLSESTMHAPNRGSRLETLAHAYRAWALANSGLYRLIASTSLDPEDPDFRSLVVASLAPYTAAMAELGLGGDDAIHAIRTLRATLHGFILLELDGQFRLGQDPDESFRRGLAIMLRGLVGPSA